MNNRMSSFNVKDKGSNYPFNKVAPKALPPRSLFDLSYLNSFTAVQGALIPFYFQHSLMNEDYSFGNEAVCRVVNPPTVPLLSRQRIYFHLYWCSYTQLWKKAQIFFDKGRLTMTPPESILLPTFSAVRGDVAKRGSLFDYLGINVVNNGNETATVEVPALKFMMYLKVWRDYYCNKRIFSAWLKRKYQTTGQEWYRILGEFLFPVDDDDFRIGSSQWDAFIANADCLSFFTSLKYRDWTDDYFTTMQMTPLYADEVPSIDFGASTSDIESEIYALTGQKYSNGYNIANDRISVPDGKVVFPAFADVVPSNDLGYFGVLRDNDNTSKTFYPAGGNIPFKFLDGTSDRKGSLVDALNSTLGIRSKAGVLTLQSTLTIDKIRNCMAETIILEKLAKTDGTYGEYARAMFGERPKSAYDMRPTFVGGTYQPIVFSQVVSTAVSQEDTKIKPQGSVTGLGLSSADGFIGKHHSDDYGLYLGVMSIMPDTYYCQGLQREDTYQTSDDFYLPERAGLGMQAVLQDELYNTAGSHDVVLGYQNRYDELRYRCNEVHGKVADDNNESFSPYIQTRIFKSAPTLSPEFLTTKDNIPNKWLSSAEEVPYILQVANKVRAVRPVPYKAEPTSFGM